MWRSQKSGVAPPLAAEAASLIEKETWRSAREHWPSLFLSFRRKPWFDEPFDRLTVLSRVGGVTTLSIAEGESSGALIFWTPAFAGVTNA